MTANDECVQCSEDFCNVDNGYSMIECLTCSSKNDSSCGFFQELPSKTKMCSELLGRSNYCVSFQNGTSYSRGCLNDFPDFSVASCQQNKENCQICGQDACNRLQLIEQSCIRCDSSSNENCIYFPEQQSKISCKNVSASKSGCYHYDKGKQIYIII